MDSGDTAGHGSDRAQPDHGACVPRECRDFNSQHARARPRRRAAAAHVSTLLAELLAGRGIDRPARVVCVAGILSPSNDRAGKCDLSRRLCRHLKGESAAAHSMLAPLIAPAVGSSSRRTRRSFHSSGARRTRSRTNFPASSPTGQPGPMAACSCPAAGWSSVVLGNRRRRT